MVSNRFRLARHLPRTLARTLSPLHLLAGQLHHSPRGLRQALAMEVSDLMSFNRICADYLFQLMYLFRSTRQLHYGSRVVTMISITGAAFDAPSLLTLSDTRPSVKFPVREEASGDMGDDII